MKRAYYLDEEEAQEHVGYVVEDMLMDSDVEIFSDEDFEQEEQEKKNPPQHHQHKALSLLAKQVLTCCECGRVDHLYDLGLKTLPKRALEWTCAPCELQGWHYEQEPYAVRGVEE